jgi:hypothetical protein
MAQKLSLDRVKPEETVWEQRWRERIERWRQSGQSQAEFCQSQGISLTSLSHWKGELARRDQVRSSLRSTAPAAQTKEPQTSDLGWQQVSWPGGPVTEPSGSIGEAQRLELVLPGGWSIRMGAEFEEESLRRLLGVLGGRPC